MSAAKDCTILAPSGSPEQLVAAVNNGCDAVYLGLDCFNARMKAPNFDRENLPKWVDFCHLYGVKVYVAINTSLKNDEFESAVQLLGDVYRSNADGVILTDTALIALAARLPKPFEIVASTQLNVYNRQGADFVRQLGADTVVCARESTLGDIEDIALSGIGVECFIHGATCVCQSGQCLFSSMVGGNSGNRGLCAQPCRRIYTADGKQGYLLSARDLCGISRAKSLCKAGVTTYKIEGRNRRAEYAAATSDVYRRLFDNNFVCNRGDETLLAEIYNRDMAPLSYLDGGNDGIVSADCQNHAGVAAGKVRHGKIDAFVPLQKGDGLKIFDNGHEVCGAMATETGCGTISAEFGGEVRDGMDVHRTTSVELCRRLMEKRRLLPVTMSCRAMAEKPMCVSAACGGVQVEVQSDFVVQKAKNMPLSAEEIAAQLKKSGNFPFEIAHIDVQCEDVFVAKSQLNALRRSVLEQLQNRIVELYNTRFAVRHAVGAIDLHIDPPKKNSTLPQIAVICYTKQQVLQAKKLCDRVIFHPEVLDEDAFAFAAGEGAYIDLPSFATDFVPKMLQKHAVPIVCHNVVEVQWARELGLNYIAGSGLNIFNDWMAAQFDDADAFVYSQELTVGEIGQFRNKSGLIFADGRLILMKLVHCPYKVATGCTCKNCTANKPLVYTDEQCNKFEIHRRKEARCTFELVNGKKLSAAGRLRQPAGYLVDFDPDVLQHYIQLNNGQQDGYVERRPYTKGRLFDKVN